MLNWLASTFGVTDPSHSGLSLVQLAGNDCMQMSDPVMWCYVSRCIHEGGSIIIIGAKDGDAENV